MKSSQMERKNMRGRRRMYDVCEKYLGYLVVGGREGGCGAATEGNLEEARQGEPKKRQSRWRGEKISILPV